MFVILKTKTLAVCTRVIGKGMTSMIQKYKMNFKKVFY